MCNIHQNRLKYLPEHSFVKIVINKLNFQNGRQYLKNHQFSNNWVETSFMLWIKHQTLYGDSFESVVWKMSIRHFIFQNGCHFLRWPSFILKLICFYYILSVTWVYIHKTWHKYSHECIFIKRLLSNYKIFKMAALFKKTHHF